MHNSAARAHVLQMSHRLLASLTARLTARLPDWLPDWLIEWLVAYLVGSGNWNWKLGCHLLGTPLMHVAAILPSTQLDYAKYWKWLNRKLSKNSRQNRRTEAVGEGANGGGGADLNLWMRIWYRTGANLKGKLAAKMLNECQIECPLDIKLFSTPSPVLCYSQACVCVCVCLCCCKMFIVIRQVFVEYELRVFA